MVKENNTGTMVGELVEIANLSIAGKPIIEGTAKLIKPSEVGNDGLNPGYEYWQVEFTDQIGEYFDRIIKVG